MATGLQRWLPFLLAGMATIPAPGAAQVITTIAGNGTSASTGDGGPASQATLNYPNDVAVDGAGNVYVASDCRIRKIDTSGTITRYAGNGTCQHTTASSGDGGPALQAPMAPSYLAWGADALYFSDPLNHRVRRITADGKVNAIAGGGSGGDGGPAISAALTDPKGLDVAADGSVYFVDDARIRRVSGGVITAVAGSGVAGTAGDGGPALSAELDAPQDVGVDSSGAVFIVERTRVRKVSGGLIRTVAGGGQFRDDPVATQVSLSMLRSVDIDARGNLLIGEYHHVYQVSPGGSFRTVVAPLCDSIFSCPGMGIDWLGDGGLATQATLRWAEGVTVAPDGRLFIADTYNQRIRQVTPIGDPPPLVRPEAFDAQTYALGFDSGAAVVAVGDVTGDGLDDVLAASETGTGQDSGLLVLYRQQADGSLAMPSRASYLSTDGRAIGIALADFNHDGILDVVVGHGNGITWFKGGSPTLAAGVLTPTPTNSSDAPTVAVDANQDGHMDVAVLVFDTEVADVVVRTYLGDGTGGFPSQSAIRVPNGGFPSLAKGDIDSDGREDLVATAQSGADGVQLLRQAASGMWQPPRLLRAPTVMNLQALAVGDLNGDGRDDVVVSPSGNAPTPFWWWTQDVDGVLEGPRSMASYDIPSTSLITDMDNDGDQDLLVAHSGWHAISLYTQASGSLARALKYQLPATRGYYSRIAGMATGDLDGDGCPDLAIADSNVGVLLKYGVHCVAPAAVRDDADGDGRSDLRLADAQGRLQFLSGGRVAASWAPQVPPRWELTAVADLAGNGRAQMLLRSCDGAAWRLADPRASTRFAAWRGPRDPAWLLAGTGDFDGDGRSDLWWRHSRSGANAVWWAGDANRSRAMPTLRPGWQVAATGDFDGDGRDDLAWRDARTGANVVWWAGGMRGARALAHRIGAAWSVAGAGDFDQDGRSDLVWRQRLDGRLEIWPGADAAAARAIRVVPDAQLEGTGDFDGDRKADLLWREADGRLVAWKGGDPGLRVHLGTWAAATQESVCRPRAPFTHDHRRGAAD